MRLIRTSRTMSAWPTMTLPTSSSIRSTMERNSETGIGGGTATVSATITAVFLGLRSEWSSGSVWHAHDCDQRDDHHDHDQTERHHHDRRNLSLGTVRLYPGAKSRPGVVESRRSHPIDGALAVTVA